MLLGAAAWGSTGTAAHFAPASATSASIGAARIALGGVLLLGLAVRTAPRRRALDRLLTGAAASRAALVFAAVAVAGYQVCFFTAVRMTGVAIGTVVAIGSAPVFTGALSRLAGGPRLDTRWMAATAAAVAGCAVLDSWRSGRGRQRGRRGPGPGGRVLLRDLRGHSVAADHRGQSGGRGDGPALRRRCRAARAGASGGIGRMAADRARSGRHRLSRASSPPRWHICSTGAACGRSPLRLRSRLA